MDFWTLPGLNNIFTLQNVLITFVILIVVFLTLREFVTWYWKINKIVHLLEQIEENTRNPKPQGMAAETTPQNGPEPGAFSKWWNGTK